MNETQAQQTINKKGFMGKPIIHAESSAKIFGGKVADYIDIHEFLDSSRDAFPDLRHRALTHNSWFIKLVIPRVFGRRRKNSSGRYYFPEAVAEHHVIEDFANNFIPSVQDYLEQLEFQPWMDNGKDSAMPPSHRKLDKYIEGKKISKIPVRVIIAPEMLPVRTPLPKTPVTEVPMFPKRGCGGRPGTFD